MADLPSLTRRTVLTLPLVSAMAGRARAATGVSRRVVALDWSVAETMLALDAPPLAMAEPAKYSLWEGSQPLPSSIVNVGLWTQPNLELIDSLNPDLILIADSQNGSLRHRLARIARVESVAFYTGDGQPLVAVRQAASHIAQMLGREAAAAALMARADAAFAAARQRVVAFKGQQVLCVILEDDRHGWVADRNSLIQSVFDQLGLVNAWTGPSSFWGFTTIGLDALAAYDAPMLVGRFTLDETAGVDNSPIWRALPPVRRGQTADLSRFWYFGALPTAMRLADLIASGIVSINRA